MYLLYVFLLNLRILKENESLGFLFMRVILIFYYKFLIEVWIVLMFLYKKKERLFIFDIMNFIIG